MLVENPFRERERRKEDILSVLLCSVLCIDEYDCIALMGEVGAPLIYAVTKELGVGGAVN
jgi:hypothetical protein